MNDVVGMALTPKGKGYWIARSTGQVYSFGNAAKFRDFVPAPCDPVTAIFARPGQQGYRLVTRTGATYGFGAYGPSRTGPIVQCVY